MLLGLALASPGVSWGLGGTFNANLPGVGMVSKPVQSMRQLKFKDLVEQKTDFSCGAASLATIMRYAYGLQVDEQMMLEGLFAVTDPQVVKRKGFSLLDIKTYVEKLGMRGRGYQIQPEALLKIRVPTIVLLDLKGYKHFVVLKKSIEKQVYIGDPALGNYVMPMDQFLNSWNGIVFAVIGNGLDRDSVLINPPEPLTARNLHKVSAPLTTAELLDFGFTHAELF